MRVQQKQQTRERVLEAAFEEFTRKGLLVTKTADIAKAAHVSHGSIFAHFPTRDALVLMVINQFGLHLGEELRKRMKVGSLESVLITHLKVLEKWEPFITQLVICGPHLPEDIRVAIFNIQSGIAFYLEQALAGMEFSSKVPRYLILNTWLGLIYYYLANRELFCPNGSVLAAKGKELVDFFIQLIKGDICMQKCNSCTSCGMPLQKASDHALSDETIPFCSHCTNSDGKLKPYAEVLEGTKNYFVHYQGIDPGKAQEMAENLLKKQPVWRGKDGK